MRRLWVSALALLLVRGAAAAPPGAFQQLEAFLEQVETLSAQFEQVQIDQRSERVEQSRGELILKRPGRFRWEYREPHERTVVADGSRLWLYEADLEQVTIRSLDSSSGETPAALLTGGHELLQRFKVIREWKEEEIGWVSLRPLSADSDFELVSIGFLGKQLARLRIDDRLGQRTEVRLSDLRINAPLGEDRFRFVVPPGADVIDDDAI